ncbi:GMC oxidoreductase, partial [Myxococcota bacterium]
YDLFIDPLRFVTGVPRFRSSGTALGPPMSVGTYQWVEEGILLSDLIDPWGMWLLMTGRVEPGRLRDFFSYRRMLGLMVKVGDEDRGSIDDCGQVSKPLSERDYARLDRGVDIAREVLVEAGCKPQTIVVGPVRGAHPGATARIGRVVDRNLETRINNLFVADASVLPEAMGTPVVLTVIALAKRLADHLLNGTLSRGKR